MEKVQTILVPAIQTITVTTRIAIYGQLRSQQPNFLRILRFGGIPTNRVTTAEVSLCVIDSQQDVSPTASLRSSSLASTVMYPTYSHNIYFLPSFYSLTTFSCS